MDDILEQLLYASQLGGGIATTRMGWDASANSALEPSTDELQASIHRTSSIPLLIGVDNKGFFPNTIQAPNAPPPSTMVFDTRQGHQYPQYLHSAASPWPSEGSPHAPHGSHRTPLNSYNGKRPREDSGLVSDLSNNIVGLLGEIPNNVAHNARSTDQISGDSTDMDGLPDLTCVAAVRAVKPRIRARRGQATDPHSIAERNRRERIAERMKALQELVPDSNKTDKASMLDEIIGYVKFLQMQVKCLSMCRLGGAAAVGPLLADLPMQVRDNKLGANLAQGITDAMPDSSHEGMAFAERQVAKLMDEDMSAAMQYLQSKGLCLMPISLATAISGTGAGTKPLVEVGSGKNANNIKQPLEVEADAMLAPAGAGRNEPRGGYADAVSPNVIYNSRGEDGGGT